MRLGSETYALTTTSHQSMKRLASPPIVEALIDLHFTTEINAQDARLWLEEAAGSHGTVSELQEHRVDIGADGPSTDTLAIGASLQGFGQSNALIQLKRASLTFNQLKPYPGWEQFECWTRSAMQDLHAVFEGRTVDRIAVRFINRINIENLASKISRYIRAFPTNHFGPDTEMHGFVTKLNVGWPPFFGNVVLATPQGSLSEILIDIEIFRQISASGIQNVLLGWDELKPEMRRRKNDAFEGVVSQELLDEFK